MNADNAHLSKQPGLLSCLVLKRQKVARGYTLQKGAEYPNASAYPLACPSRGTLWPQKKIIPHLACLLARLLRYIQRHVSRYTPLDVPCRRTQIRRNLVELFFTVTLIQKESRGQNPRLTECFFGGDEGIRTLDFSVANAALSQLSYIPI